MMKSTMSTWQKLFSHAQQRHQKVSLKGIQVIIVCHDGPNRLLVVSRSQKARDEKGEHDDEGTKLIRAEISKGVNSVGFYRYANGHRSN